MVGPDGIEPSTSPLSGVRSSHLSYGPRCSSHCFCPTSGGAGRDRTGDLLNANQALSQLSYSPISESSAALFHCPPLYKPAPLSLSQRRLAQIQIEADWTRRTGPAYSGRSKYQTRVENTESNGVERLLSTLRIRLNEPNFDNSTHVLS